MAKTLSKLPSDFRDLLQSFVEGEVRFLVVGAYAVITHGHARTTGDLDVWVKPTKDNAKRAFEALKRFGAPLLDLTVSDLSRPDMVFQMGVPPARVDVLTSISGVTFDEAWPHRVEVSDGALTVNVIGGEELLRNKRATGRPRDLTDVAALEKIFAAAKRR